ncbi:MAG: flippase [Motiliproteus sp.]
MVSEKFFRFSVGLFVTAWVARYLGVSGFGELSFALSFVFLFSAFSTMGIDTLVVKSFGEDEKENSALITNALLIKVAGSLLAILMSFISICIYKSDDDYSQLLVFICSLSFIFQSFSIVDLYFQSKLLSKYSAACSLLSFLIVSLVKIYLIFIESDLIWFAAVNVLEAFILSFFLLYSYYSVVSDGLSFRFSLNKIKSLVVESFPVLVALLSYCLYSRVDQIMLENMLGVGSVGLYSAAYKLYEVPFIITIMLARSLVAVMSDLYKNNIDSYYNQYHYLCRFWTAVSYLLVFFFFFFSPLLVETVFGSEYVGASSILVILSFGQIAYYNAFLRSNHLIISGNSSVMMKTTFCSVFINIFLNYIMIPLWGGVGAALSTVITQFLSLLLFNLFFEGAREIGFIQLRSLLLVGPKCKDVI